MSAAVAASTKRCAHDDAGTKAAPARQGSPTRDAPRQPEAEQGKLARHNDQTDHRRAGHHLPSAQAPMGRARSAQLAGPGPIGQAQRMRPNQHMDICQVVLSLRYFVLNAAGLRKETWIWHSPIM